MKKLIFLPIELTITKTFLNVDSPLYDTFDGLWNTRSVEADHPEIKYLIDQLPFSNLSLIKYNTQATDVPPHVDVQLGYVKDIEEYKNIIKNEPAGYRILLVGKEDALEVHDGKDWVRARLPACPFAYVLNSTTAYHRVINQTGRKTLYFRGFLDKERHHNMISENFEKYKDYAIFRK